MHTNPVQFYEFSVAHYLFVAVFTSGWVALVSLKVWADYVFLAGFHPEPGLRVAMFTSGVYLAQKNVPRLTRSLVTVNPYGHRRDSRVEADTPVAAVQFRPLS